ncbi:hypothetical protein ACK2IE_12710 [Clostridioides difficile]
MENNENKDLTIPALIELEIALGLEEKYLVNYFADEYIKKENYINNSNVSIKYYF